MLGIYKGAGGLAVLGYCYGTSAPPIVDNDHRVARLGSTGHYLDTIEVQNSSEFTDQIAVRIFREQVDASEVFGNDLRVA